MKRMMHRTVALVMCLVLLMIPMQLSPVTAENEQPILAYVPLDNRPVVYNRVQWAAGGAGFDIRLPDESLFTTLLDGQGGTGLYGSQHGDGAAIMDWLDQMEADGCNYYIIHLDQMFSGGLVGSRHPDSSEITDTELDIMERLLALNADPTNHVYFIDIVMRLASTGSYKGYDLDQYGALRTWGAKDRYVMDATPFSTTDYDTSVQLIDEIESYYRTAPDGSEIAYDTSALTEENVLEYLSFRKRKLTLMNMMIQNMGAGTTYMVGVDDSSPNENIQYNELQFLDARMEAMGLDYTVMADTDSIGLMAVARCVNDYYGIRPKLKVRYYGSQIDAAADEYANTTLRECIDSHIRSLNADSVSEGGEVEVLVLTKPDGSFTSSTDANAVTYADNVNALIAQANANIAANVPTIIIEASDIYGSAWGYDCTNLQDELLANVDITKLMGYSNWNTVGNATGIALGVGVSRYTYLKYEEHIAASSHDWNLKSMAYAFAKDIAYNARNKLNYWAPKSEYSFHVWLMKSTVNGREGDESWAQSPAGSWADSNFYEDMDLYDGADDGDITAGKAYVEEALTNFMMGTAGVYDGYINDAFYGDCTDIMALMEGGEFYTNLNRTVQTMTVTDVTMSNFRFPWHRHFEIIFDIETQVESAANTYYTEDGSFMESVPLSHTAAEMIANVKEQFGAASVVLKDQSGAEITGTALVPTGTQVITDSTTYYAVVLGDVDSDAALDSADVRRVMQSMIGKADLTDAQTEASDFNEDGKVSSTDARQMLQIALKR